MANVKPVCTSFPKANDFTRCFEALPNRRQTAQDLFGRRDTDVVLGEIDPGLEKRNQLDKLFLPRSDAARDRAFHLLRRDASLIQGSGFNEVADRLSLRQIDAAVEIGAQSEFARFGQARTSYTGAFDTVAQDNRRSMARDFHHIFGGVRTRRLKISGYYAINRVAFRVHQIGQQRVPALPIGRLTESQNLFGDAARFRSGKAHHSNAAAPRRSRNRNDGVLKLQKPLAAAVRSPARSSGGWAALRTARRWTRWLRLGGKRRHARRIDNYLAVRP